MEEDFCVEIDERTRRRDALDRRLREGIEEEEEEEEEEEVNDEEDDTERYMNYQYTNNNQKVKEEEEEEGERSNQSLDKTEVDPSAGGIFEGWPLELRYHPQRGRYVVCTRDLEAGEVAIRSEAYAVAVCENFKFNVCSFCWKQSKQRLQDSLRCENCKETFYCSQKCLKAAMGLYSSFDNSFIRSSSSSFSISSTSTDPPTSSSPSSSSSSTSSYVFGHDPIECYALKRLRTRGNRFSIDDNSEIRVVVQAIARRFRERFGDYVPSSQLQGESKMEKQADEVLEKQDQEEKQKEKQAQEKKKAKKSWELSFVDWERLVGNRDSRDFNGLMEIKKQAEFVLKMVPSWSLVGLTVDDIMDLFMKLKCNCFGVWSPKRRCLATAVYPTASFFNHSCLCNCARFSESPTTISIRTLNPVKEGTELCISYVDPKEDLDQRRLELDLFYFFSCTCARCDPYNAPSAAGITAQTYLDRSKFLVEQIACDQKNCTGVKVPLHPRAEGNYLSELPNKRVCNFCSTISTFDYHQLFEQPWIFDENH